MSATTIGMDELEYQCLNEIGQKLKTSFYWSCGSTHFDIKFIAPSILEVLGHQGLTLKTKKFTDLLHDADLVSFYENVALAKEKKRAIFHHRLFTKSGQSKWFQTELVFSEDGDLLLGETFDISSFRSGFSCDTESVYSDRLRALFDYSTDLICIAGLDGYFKEVNPAFERTLGYTEKELLYEPFINFVHPDDVFKTEQFIEFTRKGMIIKDFENRYKTKDGNYKWLSWMSHPIPQTENMYAVARDISSQKNFLMELEKKVEDNNRKLLESTEFLETILENMPEMVFVKDARDLRYVLVNSALTETLEYTKEEMLGKNDYDFFPKEQADFFTSKDRYVLSGMTPVNAFEEEIKTKNGMKVLRTRKMPVADADGKPLYLIGLSEDITEEKKRSQSEIQDLKDRIQFQERSRIQEKELFFANVSNVLSSSLDYMETLDKLAKITVPYLGDWCGIAFLNEEGYLERAAIHHRDPAMKETTGKLFKFALFGSNSERVTKTLREGKSFLLQNIDELTLRRATENSEHLEIYKTLGCKEVILAPIVHKRKISGLIAIFLGDNERHFTQEDLKNAEELGKRAGVALENAKLYQRAQRAIAVRDEFLSVASHELKTPVTALKLQLQMAQKYVSKERSAEETKEKIKKYLEQANLQINKLTDLMENLLDVSRSELRHMHMKFEPLDLSKMMRDVGTRYQEHLRSFDCDLIMDIKEGFWILGDKVRLEQVITNLLTNAAKFGQGHPVKMKLKSRDANVVFKISDEGIGIPRDKQHKIFERFERAVESKNIAGLGLGLYISKQIVEAHEGEIFVKSRPGKGATFTVEIPRFQDKSVDPDNKNSTEHTHDQNPSDLPNKDLLH